MKTLLILTHYFPPENVVGALRPFRLARHLGRNGWRCVVLTRKPENQHIRDFSLVGKLPPGTEIHYTSGECYTIPKAGERSVASIFRPAAKDVSSETSVESRVWARALGNTRDIVNRFALPDIEIRQVPKFIRRAESLIRYNPDCMLLTTSPPHSIHVAGLILSKRFGVPWVVDYRDPWDDYVRTGKPDLRNPLGKWLSRRILKQASVVVSTTETNTSNLVTGNADLPAGRFHTVTNSYNKQDVAVEGSATRNVFTVGYTGIFYPNKDPFTFFRALRTWFDDMDDTRLRLLNGRFRIKLVGSRTKAVVDVIQSLGLSSWVSFVPRVSHGEAIRITKGCDLLLIAAGIGKRTRPGWLTSKLFEYLGCKIPILAVVREGEMARIIRQTNSGYVVTGEDHQAIINVLETEMERKLKGGVPPFTYEGVGVFEETAVFNGMKEILERGIAL